MKLLQLVLVGVVLAVVVIFAAWLLLFRAQVVSVESAEVVSGPIEQFIDERGQTHLPREYLITMPYEARIEQITLEAGDRVEAGQVVAQIVERDLAESVAEAQATVQRLAASIEENDDVSVENVTLQQAQHFVESMGLTVAAARERLEPSQARLDFARTQLDRIEGLFQQQVATQEELDRARVAYTEAESDHRQNVLTLRTAQAIEAATKLMPDMINEYIDRRQTLTHEVLVQQRAEAEASLQQVLTRQERGRIVSPVDGVVLERLESNERLLPAGELLLRIGQLADLEVEADILSQEVVDIEKDDRTVIYGPAVGADEEGGVDGYVKRVHPAGFTKVSSLGVEQQRVTVVIGFAAGVLEPLLTQRDLGVDYRVRVRVITDSRDNALIVPRSALFRGPQGSWQVMAIRADRAHLTDVEVGLMNDDIAEIRGGLEEGDSVILAPESSVTEGTRVSGSAAD